MLFVSCVCLSLWVGYMFGVSRQLSRGLKELEAAHATAKFWKDTCEQQSSTLPDSIPAPPSITSMDLKK